MREEIADIAIYLIELADNLSIDLGDALREELKKRQPAVLGFKGREHSTGRLLYDKGSGPLSTQMHEAALTALADKAINWIAGGSNKDTRPRLKSSPLRPKRWVIEQIAETVALYNEETIHDREGFARIEFQCPHTGALKHRMESSNERWQALARDWPAEDGGGLNAIVKFRFGLDLISLAGQKAGH